MSDSNLLGKMLTFDSMITPAIIQIIYYLGLVVTIIGGLIFIFQGGTMIIMGLVYLVLGPLLVRIYCELMIVLFKLYENIKEMNDRGKNTL